MRDRTSADPDKGGVGGIRISIERVNHTEDISFNKNISIQVKNP